MTEENFLNFLLEAKINLEKADDLQKDFHICNLGYITEKLEEYIFRTELRIHSSKSSNIETSTNPE